MRDQRYSLPAMATAMYEDRSINESEIRNQVNRHPRAGVDRHLLSLGTNGEFYILRMPDAEKKRVMRICVDEARGTGTCLCRDRLCGHAGYH